MKSPPEFRDDWVGPLVTVARSMWKLVYNYEWQPNEFESLFDRVYCNTDDLETLWQLGGATNDYLRRYPGSLRPPCDLPRRLLRSDDREARVIGLKLLNRCGAENEIIYAIIGSLKRTDEYEEVGGIYETGNLIDRCEELGVRLPSDAVSHLIKALQAISANRDENDQRIVADHIVRLQSLCS